MAVDDPNVIDILSDDPHGRVILSISDHLGWSEPLSHLSALQDKLNRYLAFIESGEILEHRPQAAEKTLAIRVELRFAPPAEERNFSSAQERSSKAPDSSSIIVCSPRSMFHRTRL